MSKLPKVVPFSKEAGEVIRKELIGNWDIPTPPKYIVIKATILSQSPKYSLAKLENQNCGVELYIIVDTFGNLMYADTSFGAVDKEYDALLGLKTIASKYMDEEYMNE